MCKIDLQSILVNWYPKETIAIGYQKAKKLVREHEALARHERLKNESSKN